jgi:hypothetical protein
MTYDLISHPQSKPDGMLGGIPVAVNYYENSTRAEAGIPEPRARPAGACRAIIPVRLHTFEAFSELSTGESRD